jgi:site-specific recombinase XerD
MNNLENSTLKDFKNYLKLKNYSNKTIESYSGYLFKFIKSTGKSAKHLSAEDFNNFLKSNNFTSYQQHNAYISSVKIFYEKILKRKFIKIDFSRPRNEKKLPQIIDSGELLFSISKISNIKHKSIISLAYSVGLRVSEVINLKIEDIDSKRMIIHIKNAKGRKDRLVPLSENILKLLREYFIEYKPNEYLFNGQNSSKYSSASCNAIVKKYIDKKYHFHLLRHSCFTHLIENGTDCRIIQKIAGHSTIKTTEGYMQVSTKVLSKIKLAV